MIKAPVLAIPDFGVQFVLETDACNTGIRGVLMQKEHPVAYLSKALLTRSQDLSTYEKECLAIIYAIDKWRPYLQHAEFIIRTDQSALSHLNDQRLVTPWQRRAYTKLMGM